MKCSQYNDKPGTIFIIYNKKEKNSFNLWLSIFMNTWTLHLHRTYL